MIKTIAKATSETREEYLENIAMIVAWIATVGFIAASLGYNFFAKILGG